MRLAGRLSAAIEVLSFDGQLKDWSGIERDAGHFLFAVQQLDGVDPVCVVQAPKLDAQDVATESYGRVRRWLDKSHVETLEAGAIASFAQRFAPVEQLPLLI